MILLLFLAATFIVYFRTHRTFYLFDLPYIGFSLFIGFTLHQILPKSKRQIGRRVAQFMVGLYFLLFLAFLIKVNMQIEGFFFQVFSLVFSGAFIHYSISKLFGPLYFGRGFCGWACWNAMVFDLLPFRKSRGRIPQAGWLRYLHLGIVIAAIALLSFKYHYSVKTGTMKSLMWFIAGNALYYITGIALAMLHRDNRAFCKYVCPIAPIQKVPARFAVLKFNVDPDACTECGACEKACPMDIRIMEYKRRGLRVGSTECIFCNACHDACPTGAIALTSKIDSGTGEYLKFRGWKA